MREREEERGEEGRPARRRRFRRGRQREDEAPETSVGEEAPEPPAVPEAEPEEPVVPGAGREAPAVRDAPVGSEHPPTGGDEVEGVVDVLGGGSGFLRLNPPDPSDEDVYVSAAQVRRFELVSGDRVSGPRRPPRRSERFASLVRVETVNGQPASELAGAGRGQERPAAWPSELLPLEGGDPSVLGVLAVAPIGRGSRVTVAGPPQSGKTELLKRIAAALSRRDDLELRVVLAGVRPEEITEWEQTVTPLAALDLGSSRDSRSQSVDSAVEQARRLASRGSHSVVLIDTLDELDETAARRALAAARSTADGGSVTVIATASHALGGETTLVSLSPLRAAAGQWPAVDVGRTWTMRPELLVGPERAEEIGRVRAQALGE